jgi:glycosyltransferase involved in cell wall biosynthesis
VLKPLTLIANGGSPFEIIVVDDGSRDSSMMILKEFKQTHEIVRILAMHGNHGHMKALIAGMSEAIGEFVLTMDGDGQDPQN